MKKLSARGLLTITFVMIVIAVVVAYAGSSNREDQNMEPNTEVNSDTNNESNTPEVREPATSFSFTSPEEWEHTGDAEEAVNALAEGQRINFGIVKDPTDENIHYFSTNVFDEEKDLNLLSIYKYNTNDLTWERLYRAEFGTGDFRDLPEQAIPLFHVLGYDDGKLVILAQDMSDSPGPCTEPILLGYNEAENSPRELISMSIMEPYSGFSSYIPPEDVIDEAEQRQSECLETIQ